MSPFLAVFLGRRFTRVVNGGDGSGCDPLSPDGLDVADDGVDAQPAEVLDPKDLLVGEAVVGRFDLHDLQIINDVRGHVHMTSAEGGGN